MKVIITGGHHSSALPVIDEFRAKHIDVEVFWVGHRHSLKGDCNDTLEYKEITALGIPFFNLHAGKVYKTFDPLRLLKVPLGFFQALHLLSKTRPDVVLSFGGYLAVPVVIAAWFLGIPSVTHEQTLVVGYANKLISRFAKKIFVSWPQSENLFPKNKVIFTGLPLRKSIFNVSSINFNAQNNLPTVFIMGGKTGSHFLNNLVVKNLKKILSICNVIHQCGDNSVFNDFEYLNKIYKEISGRVPGKYFPRKFILEDEIGEAYSRAAFVIARSGAHTIAELLALEKPCLLIPIPWVSHNEQKKSAEYLKENGLAIVLDQNTLTDGEFLSSIDTLIKNPDAHKLRNRDLLDMFKINSSEIICNETINTAKKN